MNKVLELGKVDRIPIDLSKSKSKWKQTRYESREMILKLALNPKLVWKIVETL